MPSGKDTGENRKNAKKSVQVWGQCKARSMYNEEASEWTRHGETRMEGRRRSAKEAEKKRDQFIEPNNCSRRSSTVHCISDDDPALCEVACDCGRCGRMLKDPESMPFDRFSIRRPICAELLKNT